MGKLVNFVTSLHQATNRAYLDRMKDDKINCMLKAKEYEFDYWDGMLAGIDMKLKEKPGKAGFECFKACYDVGVNFKATGDCLIIAPQFICEKKHIDEIIEKLRTGISNYMKK